MSGLQICPMRGQGSFLMIASAILIISMLVGCGLSTEDLEGVDYTPLPSDDWQVSTPAEQGAGSDAGGGALSQCG